MKYLFTLYGEEGEWQEQSPEEMQAMLDPWIALDNELREAGVFVAGEAVQPSATATTVRVEVDDQLVTDGPFAETKEQIGGFYLLDCADLDEALGWAKKVPVGAGGSIEVRPIMDFDEMPGSGAGAGVEAAS